MNNNLRPRAQATIQRERLAATLLDAGLTIREIGDALGLGERNAAQLVEHVRIGREAVAEAQPEIDARLLSMSAQEKLQAAINQEARKLRAAFDRAVEVKVKRRVKLSEEALLEGARRRERDDHDMLVMARRVVKQNGALISKETYNLIWSCLHPDSRNSVSAEKLDRAFRAFIAMEKLIGAAEPVLVSGVPFDLPTPEERAAMRRKSGKRVFVSQSLVRR